MVEELCDYAVEYAKRGRSNDFAALPPWDGRHVWDWFQDLMATRQVGMDECPISYQEIEAYCRLTDTLMRPWEVKAIVSLFWALKTSKPKGKGEKGVREITDADDVAGVKDLTAGLGKKRTVVRRSK
ncbi:phage tail assembly chaperone [Shinella pollutisoli]|uniref:phage tail assembly chaperone n=1 Tax=Shinella pollutisoli TaxID=2250594 RepID=UPI003FA3D7B0